MTVAGVYVAYLVNAARSHAAATCAATVRNGARLAKAFSAKAPADGEAARIYADAVRVLRAEIEQISADELCGRQRMRALVDPALARVVDSSGDVETSLDLDATP